MMSLKLSIFSMFGFIGADASSIGFNGMNNQQHWLYSIARLVFYSIISFCLYNHESLLIQRVKYSVSYQFFKVFNISVKFSILIFIIITATRARHRQSGFFHLTEKLKEISNVLKISSLNTISKFTCYLLISLFLFCWTLFLLQFHYSRLSIELKLKNFIYLLRETIILMFLWSFSDTMCMLNKMFEVLNERLLKFNSRDYSYMSIFSTLEKDEFPLLSYGAIGELHWRLCDIANSINSCYNEQLFPLTFAFFVALINNIGVACFDVLDYTERETVDSNFMELMLWNFSRMLIYSLFWLIITFPAANLSRESRRTLDIAKKLHSEYLPIETRKKLETLTLQLMHNKVEINVFGIYSLDKSLLQSISRTSFTFAVFMMQFRSQN